MGQPLNSNARLYVGWVVTIGALAGAWALSTVDRGAVDLPALAVFGSLTLLAPLASMRFQGNLPTTTVYQVASAFAYPLFLLGPPGVAVAVFAAYLLMDWLVNRRRWVQAIFNFGQLTFAAALAVAIVLSLDLTFVRTEKLEPSTILLSILPILTFVLVNHILTHIIVCLSSRRPIFPLNWYSRTGLATETLMVVTGVSAAVLWWVSPALVPLAIVPVGALPILIARLVERESRLTHRETEVRSLQGLGLKIGAELDRERLCSAVLQIVEDALDCSACLLAFYDAAAESLQVESWRGLESEPPRKISTSGFHPQEGAEVDAYIAENPEDLWARHPGLSFVSGKGAMIVPLGKSRARGILVLIHDDTRRPFDESDRHRMETLVPFMNVALDNATLVGELKAMHDHLIQHEKLSALGMLVAGVAHELNNPLTTVLGYAEMLSEQDPDSRRRGMAQRITKETKRAARIVQNLLTFSRKHVPERKRISIHRVLNDVIDFRAYDLSVKNVVILRDFSVDIPEIDADAHQLHQVFLNLLSNAEQSIARTDNLFGQVVIRTLAIDDCIRIEIVDNGRGIDPENLKQIFLPFFTTKEVGEGTGLGLSICYGIIESHGGRIHARSVQGEGATFTIELPRATPRPRRIDFGTATPRVAELAHCGRLLVIDDEESILHLVSDYLEAKGWRVSSATEGSQALELLHREDFDVLLVDVRMPGMGGREFYETLKRDRPELARRVVFATGNAEPNDDGHRWLAQREHLLQKPYNLRELTGLISKVMRN